MTDTNGAQEPRRTWPEVVVRWVFVLAVLGGLAVAVGDRWGDVRASLGTVSVGTMVAAWLVVTVALVGPWRAWGAVIADFGDRIPWRTSAKIFFVGQLGKYVPGAIWPVVIQMRLAKPAGVTRTRIAISFVITLILGVATGLAGRECSWCRPSSTVRATGRGPCSCLPVAASRVSLPG